MTTKTILPNVHANDREIPTGKVLIAEPRDLTDSDPRAEIEHLDRRTAWNGRKMVNLVAKYAGWACAGSMMRWDNGAYGVLWDVDGSRCGKWFKTFDDANAWFKSLPE